MKTVLVIGIVLTLASVAVSQDTQPVAVYPAVTSGGGVLTLDLPQDIKAVDKVICAAKMYTLLVYAANVDLYFISYSCGLI